MLWTKADVLGIVIKRNEARSGKWEKMKEGDKAGSNFGWLQEHNLSHFVHLPILKFLTFDLCTDSSAIFMSFPDITVQPM